MALGRCSWTQLEGKRQSTKKEMKHFVSPNRASAFYSVLICRGQSECWPGRADQVVSLQASRMRQLFKSSCLDLQFQPVDQHSIKRVLPGTRQRCGFYTDEQEHSSPKEMQMQGKKEKKNTLFPGFAISWPRPLLSEFPRDVHNSIWKQQRKTDPSMASK